MHGNSARVQVLTTDCVCTRVRACVRRGDSKPARLTLRVPCDAVHRIRLLQTLHSAEQVVCTQARRASYSRVD